MAACLSRAGIRNRFNFTASMTRENRATETACKDELSTIDVTTSPGSFLPTYNHPIIIIISRLNQTNFIDDQACQSTKKMHSSGMLVLPERSNTSIGAQERVTTASKKLRGSLVIDGSLKRDLSVKMQKMKSTSSSWKDKVVVVGPRKQYESLECGSSISHSSSTLNMNSSTKMEGTAKKIANQLEIHRGCYT